jgi:hypothetical protein
MRRYMRCILFADMRKNIRGQMEYFYELYAVLREI